MSPDLSRSAKNFFSGICDIDSLLRSSSDAFVGNKSGEFFVEYFENENIHLENGTVMSSSFNSSSGLGLRTYLNDKFSYVYSSDLSKSGVTNAVQSSLVASRFYNAPIITCSSTKNQGDAHTLYSDVRYINSVSLSQKVEYLINLEKKVRDSYENVQSVASRLISSWQVVLIAKSNGVVIGDVRPLTRMSLFVILERNGAVESGSHSAGGRYGYDQLMTSDIADTFVKKAIDQATVKLSAKPAPAGEFPVVLGNGWTGILLHEAVGHGLEADANRKKTSVFSDKLGTVVAAPGVTVIDDGTIPQRRGSLNIDDEGNSTSKTVLIEDGKLVGYMYDEMNAALMNAQSTGNGRRESCKHPPMPRMTNTFMLGGQAEQNDIISEVKHGIFAKSFADGQVDTTSGNFVFSSSEAYMIENGKLTYPIKGAMLIGNGTEVLKQISIIGNDTALDDGVGTCGKDGQWVPVGVGLPSILINKITVGGSNVS